MGGPNQKFLGSKLDNHGTVNWLGGQLFLTSSIDNQAGATSTSKLLVNERVWWDSSNFGTITKSDHHTFFDSVPFNNSGSVKHRRRGLRFGRTSGQK